MTLLPHQNVLIQPQRTRIVALTKSLVTVALVIVVVTLLVVFVTIEIVTTTILVCRGYFTFFLSRQRKHFLYAGC